MEVGLAGKNPDVSNHQITVPFAGRILAAAAIKTCHLPRPG
jgi:hypothetical protein